MLYLYGNFNVGCYIGQFLTWGIYCFIRIFAMLITFFCIYKRDMLKKALAICLCVWLPTLLCMLPERKSVLITCFMNHTVSQQRSTAGRFVKWKEAINIFGLFRQQELEVVTMPLLRILIDRKGKDYLHPMLPILICRSRLKKALSEL